MYGVFYLDKFLCVEEEAESKLHGHSQQNCRQAIIYLFVNRTSVKIFLLNTLENKSRKY